MRKLIVQQWVTVDSLTKFVASSKLDDAPGATFPPRLARERAFSRIGKT
jgi:hypothetical protein